jgi:predicted phosphodiesterase
MLKIEKNVIEIGLEKPLKILHMTDSHLPFYCDSDSENMIRQGKNRNEKRSVRNLNELIKYGEKKCDLIVHTGDLIDYISKPCVEFAKEFLKRDKFLFVAGNHEYAKYDGVKEDMAYRLNSLEEIGGYPVNIFFNSHITGGVNFVGIDDAYHQVEYEQLEMLKEEVKKGYPIILFVHAPLYEKELYKESYKFWNCEICLLGSDTVAHPEVVGDIGEPSESTKAFYDYVVSEPQIKAVLAGHLHFSFESRLSGGTLQYVTNRGDEGNAREITII